MILDENVTPDFHLSEFIVSDTAARLGLDNTPPTAVLATMRNVLLPGMQHVRDLLGKPVTVKSGYRSTALNAAVKGARTSQHLTGNACDFVCPAFAAPSLIARFLAEHVRELNFDQLIMEGGWVHISFAEPARNQTLTAHFTDSGVTYTPGVA